MYVCSKMVIVYPTGQLPNSEGKNFLFFRVDSANVFVLESMMNG